MQAGLTKGEPFIHTESRVLRLSPKCQQTEIQKYQGTTRNTCSDKERRQGQARVTKHRATNRHRLIGITNKSKYKEPNKITIGTNRNQNIKISTNCTIIIEIQRNQGKPCLNQNTIKGNITEAGVQRNNPKPKAFTLYLQKPGKFQQQTDRP